MRRYGHRPRFRFGGAGAALGYSHWAATEAKPRVWLTLRQGIAVIRERMPPGVSGPAPIKPRTLDGGPDWRRKEN